MIFKRNRRAEDTEQSKVSIEKENELSSANNLDTSESLKKERFKILQRVALWGLLIAVVILVVSVAQTTVNNVEAKRAQEISEKQNQVRIEISKEEIWKRKTERELSALASDLDYIKDEQIKNNEEIKSNLEKNTNSILQQLEEQGKTLNEKFISLKDDTSKQISKTGEEAQKVAKLQADMAVKKFEQKLGELERSIKPNHSAKVENGNTAELPPSPISDQGSNLNQEGKEELEYINVTINQVPVVTTTLATSRLEEQNTTTDNHVPNFSLLTSIGKATLINGVAAPTFTKGEKGPVPTLLRVDSELIMPNDSSAQTEGCFLLGVASGDISSERVEIRLSSLSCVLEELETGKRYVSSSKVQGWVFGDEGTAGSGGDSMFGLKGRLVTRNGTMLLRLLMVGFLQGVSNSFADQEVLIPGFQKDAGGAIQNSFLQGAFTGSNTALDKLAEYYMKMADETFPVIEIMGGRQVSFMLQGGESIETKEFDAMDIDYYQNRSRK